MSSRCDQNGRQPPIPGKPQNLSDSEPHDENFSLTENKKDICRNFIWGTCNKNTLCRFRHDLDIDEMKKVLKFCHDYQNSPGCAREHCTYLHTTKEEESLFFTTGQLPRVLAERHANMSSAAAETIPQIAKYIQESLVGHPPPPPPPPAPMNAPPPAPAALPAAVPVTRQTPNMLPLQHLLPPPPPPTVPSTVATSQCQVPMFTAPPPQNTAVYAQQSPTILPKFDASRPPPPIPAHAQTKNGSLKRTSLEECNAQPFKIKKTDEENDAVAHCDQCVQREIRVEALRDKISRLQRDEESQALAYKQGLLEYQNRKNILKSLVNQDLYNLIEEYIEIISNLEFHDVLAQFNQTSTIIPGMSAVPKQFLIQLIDYMLGSGRNLESMLSTLRMDETLLQTLIAPRRTNTPPTPDVLHSFLDLLKQSNAPEQRPASDFTTDVLKNVGHKDNANGCHRLTNGQSAEPPVRTAPPPTYQYAGPPPPPAPAAAAPGPSRLYYPPPYQPPAGVSVPPPSAPPPPCPAYHAARYPPAFYRQQQ